MKKPFFQPLLWGMVLLISLGIMLPVSALEPAVDPKDPAYEIVVPLVGAEEKLHDFAGLFTEEERQNLLLEIEKFPEYLSMDFVLVTTDDAKGLSAMEYADDFYDYNGYGLSLGTTEEEQDNGMLLLIDMDNRQAWVSTKGAAIRVYRDSDIETILDAVVEYLADAKYYEAASAGIASAVTVGLQRYQHAADSEVGKQEIETLIDDSYDMESISEHQKAAEGPMFQLNSRVFRAALIPAGILTLITVLTFWGAHKRSLSTAPSVISSYLSSSGIRPLKTEDLLINSHVTQRRLPDDPPPGSSGGSGFGGGGSSHTSSSGSSHGGGGRSF